MTDLPPLLRTIAWGEPLAQTTVTVRFVPDGTRVETGTPLFSEPYTAEGWLPVEIAAFTAVFDRIEAVSGLRFVTTNRADATLQLVADTDELEPDTLGFFIPPGEINAGIGVFNVGHFTWDSFGPSIDPGGVAFATMLHEVLHGLGMAHPHDRGGTSTLMKGVTADFDDYGTYDLNQGIFTAMSYNTGYSTGAPGQAYGGSLAYGSEIGPMALDIALLQALYGANMAYATGDNSYFLPPTDRAGTGWKTIWDAGGTDQIRYGGNRDATVDLRAATLKEAPGGGGYVSGVAGVEGGLTIAHGVMIERALTGGGDDRLIGNAGNNWLDGQHGADLMLGGSGGDRLFGRTGTDDLRGSLGSDRLYGGADADRLVGQEGTDDLDGGCGNDLLGGGLGRDVLYGGTGDDRLYGGEGGDRLVGGAAADRLYGQSSTDWIIGGAGRDILYGGAGADVFDINQISDSRAGATTRDLIGDFGAGDRIDLRTLDADRGAAGDQAFTFIGRAAFSGAGGEVRLKAQPGGLVLEADIAGVGRAGQADIALWLRGAAGVDDSDIWL